MTWLAVARSQEPGVLAAGEVSEVPVDCGCGAEIAAEAGAAGDAGFRSSVRGACPGASVADDSGRGDTSAGSEPSRPDGWLAEPP